MLSTAALVDLACLPTADLKPSNRFVAPYPEESAAGMMTRIKIESCRYVQSKLIEKTTKAATRNEAKGFLVLIMASEKTTTSTTKAKTPNSARVSQ